MAADSTKRNRLSLDFPAEFMRKLILLAARYGDKRNTYARSVLIHHISGEWDKTVEWLEDKASRLEISRDELEKAILERAKFDFSAEEEELNLNDGED